MIRKYRWVIAIIATLATLFCVYNSIVTSNFSLIQPVYSKGLNCLFNALTFALFCVSLVLGVVSGKSKILPSLRKAASVSIWVLLVAIAASVLSAFWSPKSPLIIISILEVMVLVFTVLFYYRRRSVAAKSINSTAIRRSASGSGVIKYAYSLMYGSLLIMLVASIVYFILTYKMGNNFFIMAPLASVLLALLLWRVFKWRGFLLVSYMFTLYVAAVYLYGTVLSYQFSALGVVMAFTFLYLVVLLSLVELYCRKEEAI